MIKKIHVTTSEQGLHDITDEVKAVLVESDMVQGVCTAFIQHTSASLLIQENYDNAAKRDMENWLQRLVPENDPLYTHTFEGPDDMPAHIKAALTPSSLSIPFIDGKLMLGTWQGIFLWEHRRVEQHRTIVISVIRDA